MTNDNWWDGAVNAVTGATEVVSNKVGEAAGTVGGAIVTAKDTVGGAAMTFGGIVGNSAVVAAGAIGSAAGTMTRVIGGAMVDSISAATSGAGYLIDAVGNSPLIQKAAQTFNADWLLQILEQIDISKSEAEVQRLKQQYPDESAHQIAQKIIGQKAVFAGASGFATSIVPGSAAALFSVDLIATTSLQAEMVY